MKRKADVDDEDDSPTVQVRLPDKEVEAPAPTAVDEPTVEGITGPDPLADDAEELDADDVSTGPKDPDVAKEAMKDLEELPAETTTDGNPLPTDATDAPPDEFEEEGDSDSALMATDAIDPASVKALRAREKAKREAAKAAPEPEPEAEAPEPEAPPFDDDDYAPQPGDIDLSSTVGTSSGDVQLRVAPPGKQPSATPAPKPRERAPDTRNRVPVMLFSGAMGVLVGAAVISVIAFFLWLIVG